MQAVYDDGVLSGKVLDCPFGEPGEACAIVVHGRRVRKTGPCHPLAVLRCETHERAFTVYPLGFVPYARRQLREGPAKHGVPSLTDVIRETATHGARARGAGVGTRGSWSTQQRILQLASRMFGLSTPERSLRAANTSGLTLTDLCASASMKGCRARARALHPLVDVLPTDDLLVLGARMGCWGTPHRWRSDRDQLAALTVCRGPPTTLGRGQLAVPG